MSQFIQLHLLTSYPPSNLNRDDLGRPKTAIMGGSERLRISSQSLKRHWRASDIFEQSLSDYLGTRTKRFGYKVYDILIAGGVKEKSAKDWTNTIAATFGKLDNDHPLEIEQLVHLSALEQEQTLSLAKTLASENRAPKKEELALLTHKKTSVDMAMFGRMLASKPEFNVEAACQVAHAISVHSVVVESDYFTAVDDLNDSKTGTGSAYLGESGFAAALFYSYICINKTLLIDNLDGNTELANQAIKALTTSAATVSPAGKQNSFASRAFASYVLAEKGSQQPRSLSVAYLKPIQGNDIGESAITALEKQVENFNLVYNQFKGESCHLNAITGEGSLKEILSFVTE